MDVRYITINEEDLEDLPIVDGQLIALADTPRWYYDMNDTRYSASGTMYCSMLPPEDKALNGVIYILNQSFDDSSGEDPEQRLDGAYLFLDGHYIRVSQLYNPASSDELGLVKVGTNIDVTDGGVISISSSKIRSIAGIASTSSLGLVRVGSGLEVTNSGILSVPIEQLSEDILEEIKEDPSVFPVASTESVGVVRIGQNIDVQENGLIGLTSQNVIDALGFTPGEGSASTESAGSTNQPIYFDEGHPVETGKYLNVWTTGNGKSASYSTSEGNMTTASGQGAHSEGYKTLASSVYSHAEGNMTTSSGQNAHAEGYYTLASGNYSHSAGYMSTASGTSSISQGARARATGNGSAALGVYSYAAGSTSVAIGSNAYASTAGSIVVGNNSTATYMGQTVIGSRGRTIPSFNNVNYKSEYIHYASTASSSHKSTHAHGDNCSTYTEVRLASNFLPYPLSGIDSGLSYSSQRGREIPKDPSNPKNLDYKAVSTYSYNYPEEPAGTNLGIKFPLVFNSGIVLNNKNYPWTPIFTRILTQNAVNSVEVKRASTIVSGLLATDVQPVIYCESYGPDDVNIITLPDDYGSLVIFRCWWDTTSGKGTTREVNKWGSTYYRLYYAVPSDAAGMGYAAASNWTEFGCDAISLGYAAVGGSKADQIGINWLNASVRDDSVAQHYESGQFAFWCKFADTHDGSGNGTAYFVSAAVYSLPSQPNSFSRMLQNRYEN